MAKEIKSISDFIKHVEKEVKIKEPVDAEKTVEEFNEVHGDLLEQFNEHVRVK